MARLTLLKANCPAYTILAHLAGRFTDIYRRGRGSAADGGIGPARRLAISGWFIFLAQARGVAHGSESGSSTGAPRAISSSTIPLRPQRQAQTRAVDCSKSSRTSN